MGITAVGKLGYLAAGAALCLGLAASAGAGGNGPRPTTSVVESAALSPTGCTSGPSVTATGTGTANATPDLLTMQIGVQTQASSASAALAANNTRARSLISTLEHGGVAASDIQTSNLSINPTYSNGTNPMVTGYQVNDDLSVEVHRLSSAGALIDAAAASLGNDVRFDGLAFSVSDPAAASSAARVAAVRVATTEARAMAGAAGSTLGPVCSLTDIASAQPQPQIYKALHYAAGAAATPVPVQAGVQSFSATVTVTYRLG